MLTEKSSKDWFREHLYRAMSAFRFTKLVVEGFEGDSDSLYREFMKEKEAYLPDSLARILDDEDCLKEIWSEAERLPLVRTVNSPMSARW